MEGIPKNVDYFVNKNLQRIMILTDMIQVELDKVLEKARKSLPNEDVNFVYLAVLCMIIDSVTGNINDKVFDAVILQVKKGRRENG